MGRREIPLDPTAGPVEAFAYALRQLRARAGTPSYRALSRKAGYSASALSAAASGSALPSLNLALAYAGGCGGRREEWEARWLRASQAVTGQHPDQGLGPGPGQPVWTELILASGEVSCLDDPNTAVFQPLARDDPRQVGPYRLRARIGLGSMGRVYLSCPAAGRAVAVKVVRPELAGDAAFRLRFHREVAAARRVHGRFTARVLDADTEGPKPWVATPYVIGPSLYEAVGRFGPLPDRSLWPLVGGVAEALQAVQAAGVVHRDLKPSNVLLAADGPRLIDFGITRARDGGRQQAGAGRPASVPVGSPEFVAPEQVLGKRLTFAADVFALGSLVVFAATGQSPFGEGVDAAARCRVVHDPPRLGTLAPEWRALAAGCLDKNPERRLDLVRIIRTCRERTRRADCWLPDAHVAEIRRRAAALPAGG